MNTFKNQKGYFFILLLLPTLFSSCNDDDNENQQAGLRYFRFSGCPEENHGNWQDTSFVAATENPAVIAQCLQQLGLPVEERTLFPLGKLGAGSSGYNKNGSHSFSWHYLENEWELVEVGIEIYDGCPYGDAELADYRGTIERYGGWGNRVIEDLEVD